MEAPMEQRATQRQEDRSLSELTGALEAAGLWE